MSSRSISVASTAASAACSQSRKRLLRTYPAALTVALAIAAYPTAAHAHGPVAPVASSYLARVGHSPAGLQAKVIDGDQRLWLRVRRSLTVVVLDYQGAPYLRFLGSGVEVNRNSAMYYLNQTPVAETPPSNLTRTTPVSWQRLSGGHQYNWHDGRLHALATVAISPRESYVGQWNIPLLVDGRLGAISGGLWHAPTPSIGWFWPIVVFLLCVLAARRVRRPSLDALTARLVAITALLGLAVAAAARGLFGRPTVSIFQLVELALVLAFAGWALYRIVVRRAGYFTFFAIAFVAVWEGATLIPTLLNGFVLAATPAFLTRAAAVTSLGSGAGLILLSFRLVESSEEVEPGQEAVPTDEGDPVTESFA